MSDLLFSEDLEQYRQLEITEAVSFIQDLYLDKIDPEYFKGAMAMLRRIVKMPGKIAKSKKEIEQANLIIAKALDDFSGKLAKRILTDE